MPLTTTTPVQERRQFVRGEFPPRFGIHLLDPERPVPPDGVNVSQGGLCLRLQEGLEVRSLVRFQITPSAKAPRALTCTGRVAWVVQRLDLATTSPFLYDVGIEFVDPSAMLRQLLARRGLRLSAPPPPQTHAKQLEAAVIRGRHFMPRLDRAAGRPSRWHLVVSVDGAPCFSDHYSSERAALAGWAQFKRRRARR